MMARSQDSDLRADFTVFETDKRLNLTSS
jgi:hypothetical protein